MSARNHLYDNIANAAHKMPKSRRKRSPLTIRPRRVQNVILKPKIQNYKLTRTHTHSIHCSATTKVSEMFLAPTWGTSNFLSLDGNKSGKEEQKNTCNIYYSQIVRVVRVLKNENSNPITIAPPGTRQKDVTIS